MINSKRRFDESISRIRNSHSLYVHLVEDKGFDHSIVSEILRSEIVYIIAALDRLVHDLVLAGVLEIYNGLRPQTAAYGNITINFLQHQSLTTVAIPIVELRQIIISKHKYLAFQEPDKISNALSLIWNENHKWQRIATAMGIPMVDVNVKLKNIVIRRNQIVHESDLDLFTGVETPIVKSDVEDSVNFIEALGHEIYNCLI